MSDKRHDQVLDGALESIFDSDLHDEKKAGWSRTFSNSLLSFIGAGLLSLPYAFRQVGVMAGCATMLAVGSLCLYAMQLLLECKYM